LSAKSDKHDQSQTREREPTGRAHLLFLRMSYSWVVVESRVDVEEVEERR
jgi:hypothetical protein